MRTTSPLESLNAQLRRIFPQHPTIFTFIESLKLHEFEKATNMHSLLIEIPKGQLGRKNKKDKERDLKINYFTSLLASNEIDVMEFLEAMANKVILPSSGNSM